MMIPKDIPDWEEKNQENYDDLVVIIEASQGVLAILIAVCDYGNFRDEIIARYETELAPGIPNYRVELPRGEPSMRAAIAEVVQQDEYLQNGGKAVFTVTGAEKLFFLKLGAERSEQEIFFGYLQWTREALREFRYPIILWVNNQLLVELSKKAPDFWSWRKGVFRFASKQTALVSSKEIAPFRVFLIEDGLSINDDDNYFLPLEDLQQLIQKIEQKKGTEDHLLASLYARIGEIYQRRLEKGEAQDYQKEQELGIQYLQNAVAIQKKIGLKTDLPNSLNNLAELYYSQGRYQEAEPLLLEALALRKRPLGDNYPDVATSLNNLAFLYKSQGSYHEAEPLYLQALALNKRLLGDNHPDVATSLNNLALLYYSQGRYQETEPLYWEALALRKRLLGDNHPDVATSLNNLALLYYSQGRYQEAEPLYREALALYKRLLGDNHPNIATSLNNLAGLYYSQGRYQEAELLLLEALALRKRLLRDNHPDVATSLNNLAFLYDSQGRYREAETLLLQALEISDRTLGSTHSQTVDIRKNLEELRAKISSFNTYPTADLTQSTEIEKPYQK